MWNPESDESINLGSTTSSESDGDGNPNENDVKIPVKTSDGIVYNINCNVGNQMELLYELMKDYVILPIDKVDSVTFELVLKWCEAIRDMDNPLDIIEGRSILNNILEETDTNDNMIYKLASAANYLKVHSLLVVSTQLLSDELNKTKNVEGLIKPFGAAPSTAGHKPGGGNDGGQSLE